MRTYTPSVNTKASGFYTQFKSSLAAENDRAANILCILRADEQSGRRLDRTIEDDSFCRKSTVSLSMALPTLLHPAGGPRPEFHLKLGAVAGPNPAEYIRLATHRPV